MATLLECNLKEALAAEAVAEESNPARKIYYKEVRGSGAQPHLNSLGCSFGSQVTDC